jgi:hypothetical protein
MNQILSLISIVLLIASNPPLSISGEHARLVPRAGIEPARYLVPTDFKSKNLGHLYFNKIR